MSTTIFDLDRTWSYNVITFSYIRYAEYAACF